MPARILKVLCLLLLLLTSGCATYALYTGDLRERLALTDYDGFVRSLDRSRKDPNQLLYLMEKGLVERYRGNYRQSNENFDQAERLSDRLFTRSLSREAAALVTNDAVRDYRGDAHELTFIHYYRALNYWQMGLQEDALVECRKANLRLARLAAQDGGDAAYRNDAFIQYATGLFYEAAGELNDAYVSYRDAEKAYRTYAETFGVPPPACLAEDLARVAGRLGYRDEAAAGKFASPLSPGGELVLFCETGFVPRKTQEEINLPIFEEDLRNRGPDGIETLSREIARRRAPKWFDPPPLGEDDRRKAFEGDIRAFSRQLATRYPAVYPTDPKVKYWLRVALPVCQASVPQICSVRLSASGLSADAVVTEDLSAIAQRTFQHQYPTILLRTVARGVSKYLASEAVDKKNKYLGFFADLFAASTEAADTRSWVSLPRNIRIGRLRLPPGTHSVTVEMHDGTGKVIDQQVLNSVEIREGERTFVSWRTYK